VKNAGVVYLDTGRSSSKPVMTHARIPASDRQSDRILGSTHKCTVCLSSLL